MPDPTQTRRLGPIEAPSTKWNASALVAAILGVLELLGPDVADAVGLGDTFGDDVPPWATVVGLAILLATHWKVANRRLSSAEIDLARQLDVGG